MVIGGCLTTLAIAVAVSVSANQQAIEREREARLESERSLCGVLAAFDDSYRQVPPATESGMNVAKAIAFERARRCPPVIGGR